MAKLYWRVKRDGKWTWLAATDRNTMFDCDEIDDVYYREEEE
jgi:hypothetical protein